MPLVRNQYGKGRVRIMRISSDGDTQMVSQLSVRAMIEGDFARAYTNDDNSTSVSTDTVKNVVNIVARENLSLANEPFCQAVAQKLLDSYPQVEKATVTAHETKWDRLSIGGKPHPHSFTLDSNGKPFATATMTRTSSALVSGVDSFTFMKTTQSGWANYTKDPFTTIKETNDRMCATAMVASWTWASVPKDYAATNKKILDTALEVFATTYSPSVQSSLYRMGEAVLAAVPEISDISMACPNIHYIPINLTPFGLDNQNQLFLPTDEPHGQIECTVARE